MTKIDKFSNLNSNLNSNSNSNSNSKSYITYSILRNVIWDHFFYFF